MFESGLIHTLFCIVKHVRIFFCTILFRAISNLQLMLDFRFFYVMPCVDPESFVRGGSNFDNVFFLLVDEGIKDQNSTINGPSSAFRWRVVDSPTLNGGLVALGFRGSLPVFLRNPIFL